ncbi:MULTISPECIES: GIY-YIG nuclease family protein [Flavobacterium]|uniref:GIY-YIG nuclease family protein n=1 Tax=Flavobacterium covae TaxID=2906076 RepID=A0ABW8PEP7_9FLAO|nr:MULTISPECIES: GIY-YIG nuclease family protein [Flavobacterium]AMA48755.1 methionine sulfoxide reductase [Flavobacterium covae]MCJ1805445.1 GIY-YIG nuclease family protein [Flavobacterium covae]MCJ1809693.1 GIY-YIG nuclease family protein [Flavobacterium covae]OWP80181.1 methionine sulfoxide reductase [Flavobacterium covae]POR22928.1 methionine sulfoxide reductase [Flavobacterium columnare]
MILGKSIRIYLKEGSVTGIKFAELVNQTIQSLSCPRTKIAELNKHFPNEINTQGVYFLIGYEEDTGKQIVYIGEAENVWDRLKNHDYQKDFWNEVIVFTSKDDNLTKSHIKYLESRLIEVANQTKRYGLKNGNSPSLSSLPLPDKDAMEEFLSNIKILTGTLGHKFLENPISHKNISEIEISLNDKIDDNKTIERIGELELYLNISGIKASAIQTNEGLVVLQGSEASKNPTKNYGYGSLRDSLVSEKIIESNSNDKLYFSRNYLFNSVSAAAAVILGYSVNGRNVWKNKNGKSINEIEKNELE